jgi:hypothetical protein
MNTQSNQAGEGKVDLNITLEDAVQQVTRLTKSIDRQTVKVNDAFALYNIHRRELLMYKEDLEKDGTYEKKAIECHKLFRIHKREKGKKDEMEKKLNDLEERVEKLQNPEKAEESDDSDDSDGDKRMMMPAGQVIIPESGGKVILIKG